MAVELEIRFQDLTVALVENEPITLSGLSHHLQQLGCQIIWSARDDEEAMGLAQGELPDVIFVDLRLLQGSNDHDAGWQLIRHLRRLGQQKRGPFAVVICSGTPVVDDVVLEAIRLGCSYVVKEDLWGHEQEVIAGALLAARTDSVLLSSEVAVGVEMIAGRAKESELLSPKEMEVLALVADGLTNKEIAEAQVLAVSTVKTHVSRILSKLEVDNRGKAAEWYRQQYG